MMKLFERHTTRETPDSHPELHEHLPELPEGVIVPDDISDMKLPVSVQPTNRPSAVRWMRWVPIGLGLVAGGLVLAVVMRDGGTETVTPAVPSELIAGANDAWLAGEGPGSNSLNATDPDATLTNQPQTDVTPWLAGEGPGSNSLNATDP